MPFRNFLILVSVAFVFLASPPAQANNGVIIGVSGSNSKSKSVTAMMVMVRTLGATPKLFTEHAKRGKAAGGLRNAAASDLASVDAIIIMGNSYDIDPAKYGQSKHPETKVETDLARAEYEEIMIELAIGKKTPLLGVCGGHQRINIFAGGTLNQHVPDIVGGDQHMRTDTAPFIPVQRVKITEGTMLDSFEDKLDALYTPTHEPLPENIVMENSFHHQSVKKLGKGLKINAMSDDGIIEGIEAAPDGPYAGQFIIGTQWHPEFGASPIGPKIVGALIKEARELKTKTN